MPPPATFRELLAAGKPLVMPCAHDALSARLVELAGFEAMAISGSGALGSRYGLPDLGIAALADVSAVTRDILSATRLPCMADGDDGYGDVKSVVRTVRTNEALGVGALVLEDQARVVKRPGQSAASSVVGEDEMAAKLRAAVQARHSRDFWIIARTDALGALGIDAALRRAELYLRCGADGLFVAGPRDPEHLARIGRTFRGTPLTVVVYGRDGAETPSIAELRDLGFSLILYPMALLLPMCSLFADTLGALRQTALAGGRFRTHPDERRGQAILAQAVNLDQWLALEAATGPGPGDVAEGIAP